MKLIAVIADPYSGALRRPAQVRKILRYLLKIGRAPPDSITAPSTEPYLVASP